MKHVKVVKLKKCQRKTKKIERFFECNLSNTLSARDCSTKTVSAVLLK